jgi:hypothetical protein
MISHKEAEMGFGKQYTEKILQSAQNACEGFGVDETIVRAALSTLKLENEDIRSGTRRVKTRHGYYDEVVTSADAARLSAQARARNEKETQRAIEIVRDRHNARAAGERNRDRAIGAKYGSFNSPQPTDGDRAYQIARRSAARDGGDERLYRKTMPFLIGIMVLGTAGMCLFFSLLKGG